MQQRGSRSLAPALTALLLLLVDVVGAVEFGAREGAHGELEEACEEQAKRKRGGVVLQHVQVPSGE